MATATISSVVQYWLPLLTMVTLLAYISLLAPVMPAAPQARWSANIRFVDLIEHVLGYGLLAILVFRVLQFHVSTIIPLQLALLSMLIATSYGALLEINQWFVPGRFFSVIDIGANFLGSIASITFQQATSRKR